MGHIDRITFELKAAFPSLTVLGFQDPREFQIITFVVDGLPIGLARVLLDHPGIGASMARSFRKHLAIRASAVTGSAVTGSAVTGSAVTGTSEMKHKGDR
jgi:hypothetical protein